MNNRLKHISGCFVVLGLYAAVTLPMLRSYPPVWPDEVIFYSSAAALAQGQGMGTPVHAGFLPGIDHYTFVQPPGYFFFLSLVLRFVAPAHHFVAMRLFSWFLGAAVLLLGAALLKRLARNGAWAIAGLAVLGTQIGFMQSANVGRMEMLSLAWTMAALNAYLVYREKRRGSLLGLAGFFSGLALICHPAGILAGFVIVIHELVVPLPPAPLEPRSGKERTRGRDAAIFVGCAAVPFVPWFLYILRAPNLFLAQMAAQSARKSSEVGSLLSERGYIHWILTPFWWAAHPLGYRWTALWHLHSGHWAVIPYLVFVVGLAGLVAAGRRRVEASLLGAWALGGYAINVFMPEGWYVVHFVTPSCLLLGWALTESTRRWVRGGALVTLTLAGAWNVVAVRQIWRDCRDGWQDYQTYCQTLSQMIPAHSTILLASIPDPYFGFLALNRSYRMYEFVPEGVSVNQAQVEQALGKVDYVIGADCCRPTYLVDYLTAHPKVEIGTWSEDLVPTPVVIWKLTSSPASAQQRTRWPADSASSPSARLLPERLTP